MTMLCHWGTVSATALGPNDPTAEYADVAALWMTVRTASHEDAEQLGPPFKQLGYPAEATEIPRRLQRNH